jgi:hypothetical protein
VDDDRSKDLKEKGKANANVNGKVASGASGSGSSSRTSSSRGGKGKERERGDSVHDASGGAGAVGRREDDDGWTESFLPTYVYDAMKVKKRFEHMRVSFSRFSYCFPLLSFSSFSSILLSSLLFLSLLVLMTIPLYRAATKKTPKNSSGFISTRWKKNFWRCWQLFLLLLHLFLQAQVQRMLRLGRTRNLDLLLAPPKPPPPLMLIRSRNRWCRMKMRMEMGGWRLGSGIGRLLPVRYVFSFFLSFFFFGFVSRF